MNTQENIYEMPHIKAIALAEQQTTDPRMKRELHALWLKAIKAEQMKRGQRSQMSYRRTAKKGA
jgi:hypothetical protein